jgi:hypothetical protein
LVVEIPLYHKREGYAVGKVQFSDFENDFPFRCAKLTLVAQHPEHSHECYRLIRPGETYHHTAENTALCQERADFEVLDTIRVTDDLLVEVGDGQLRVRRGETAVMVYPGEVRHLVDALVEAGVSQVAG